MSFAEKLEALGSLYLKPLALSMFYMPGTMLMISIHLLSFRNLMQICKGNSREIKLKYIEK